MARQGPVHANRSGASAVRDLALHRIKTCASNVGAGLLAKAVGQAASMPTDTPSSRASPLPQDSGVIGFALGSAVNLNSTGVSNGEETQGSHLYQGSALVQGCSDLPGSRQIVFRLQQ
ncbi:hypothetical protein ELQ88_18130 [Pseudomonas sp. MPC6]|nr:hypothetical protein ELQ88_18130 [Pseudomonas sp. MPC6]